MSEIIIFAFLGHLIGDYLLQSKAMALNKFEKGRYGALLCTLHVFLYTLAVCAMVAMIHPLSAWFAIVVFIPHWLIDRYSFASWWLKLIKGRTFDAVFPDIMNQKEVFGAAFAAIVYTVTDNTFHALCLVATIYWLL